jgi:hypothetical protein
LGSLFFLFQRVSVFQGDTGRSFVFSATDYLRYYKEFKVLNSVVYIVGWVVGTSILQWCILLNGGIIVQGVLSVSLW